MGPAASTATRSHTSPTDSQELVDQNSASSNASESLEDLEKKYPVSYANGELTCLPDEVLRRLEAGEPISWLELTNNQLTELPPRFYQLVAAISHGTFAVSSLFPSLASLASLSSTPPEKLCHLVRLDLERNAIATLPEAFGQSLMSLRVLNLKANKLTTVCNRLNSGVSDEGFCVCCFYFLYLFVFTQFFYCFNLSSYSYY
jgi:hypothetical protein